MFPSLNKMIVVVSRLKHGLAFLQVLIKSESRFDGQPFRVLVLPVYSQEMRHVSFFSSRETVETYI